MQLKHAKVLALIPALLLAACCGCHDEQPAAPGAASHEHMDAAAATGMKSGMAAAASGATAPLDKNGYIRDWLVLGPINFGADYDANDIVKEQVPGEAKWTPNAGDKLKIKSDEGDGTTPKIVDKEFTWQKVVTPDFFIDFNDIFKLDTSANIGAYAVAYLEAPEEIKGVTFSLSTNDDGLIYFNGKKVFDLVAGRALAEDSDTVENLTLNKGTNVVVFKVWNDANAWQGCIRLLDKAGKPITNVRVRSAK